MHQHLGEAGALVYCMVPRSSRQPTSRLRNDVGIDEYICVILRLAHAAVRHNAPLAQQGRPMPALGSLCVCAPSAHSSRCACTVRGGRRGDSRRELAATVPTRRLSMSSPAIRKLGGAIVACAVWRLVEPQVCGGHLTPGPAPRDTVLEMHCTHPYVYCAVYISLSLYFSLHYSSS